MVNFVSFIGNGKPRDKGIILLAWGLSGKNEQNNIARNYRFTHRPVLPSRLFSKFVSKSKTGTGLGLFISKANVKLTVEKSISSFILYQCALPGLE